MKVSGVFSFFPALLDPGTSLQCEVCHSIGKSCFGPMKTCNGGEDTCGLILHEVMIVPPEDNVPNGYQCPACYSVDSFQCGNEILNCTGSETQCVDLAGLMSSGGLSLKAAMKGCTTISECRIAGGGKNNLGIMDIKLKQFQCKQASFSARVSSGFTPSGTLVLPVLSGLILEKVLF